MSTRVRWALVALVLVVAGAVALWPRTPPHEPAAQPTPLPSAAVPTRTDLPPCPAKGSGPESLRGVTVTCMADGTQVDMAGVVSGPALVNIWATWCGPCADELPVLAAYAAEPGAVPVVTVAVESARDTATAMLTGLGVRLPALFDGADAVRRALRTPARMPVSYLVDAQGGVRVLDVGTFYSVEEVRRAVAG